MNPLLGSVVFAFLWACGSPVDKPNDVKAQGPRDFPTSSISEDGPETPPVAPDDGTRLVDEHTRKDTLLDPPPPFDWSTMTPLEFFEQLKVAPFVPVTVYDPPPEGWITRGHVVELMKFIDSEDPASYVLSALSSYIPFGQVSTVGNEACFLIEGYRNKSYPPFLCSIHYHVADPDGLRSWWRESESADPPDR